MQPIVIIIGLAVFAVLAAILLMSNRRVTTPPASETWQAFATQVNGRYTRNPLGAAQKVELVARGWPLTIEAWSTLDGPGDSILSYTKLLASGRFAPASAYMLHAEATRTAQITLNLTQRGGPPFKTGDDELDSRYTFNSTDPDKAAALLRQSAIKQKLIALYHADAYVDIAASRDALGRAAADGSWTAQFGDADSPLSVARLRDATELIASMLDTLGATGAAITP